MSIYKSLGLYVHVPFCVTTCDFCAFYQQKPKRADLAMYLSGLAKEMSLLSAESRFDTVFFGGGTPGLLPTTTMRRIGDLIADRIAGVSIEWTVEMAPSTINPSKLKALKSIGVNRISMGVQSFNEVTLQKLGREHSPTQVERAYGMIRDAGFKNVNIDLMFAIPGQTVAEWEDDLLKAISYTPEHISTYCLTFEEDTALWLKLQQGRYKIDIELERALYLKTWEVLNHSGFQQYEISNFSKVGYECRHNLNTWNMQEWVGLGPSAASQYGGRRYANMSSLKDWYEGLCNGTPKYVDEIELTQTSLAIDSLIFGLRKNEGVDLSEIEKRFPDWCMGRSLYALIEQIVDEGYATKEGSRIKLTLEGRCRTDAIGAEILSCEGR